MIKNIFDIYKKNSQKGRISTKIGVIFTVFFVLVLIIILYNDIYNYLKPKIISEIHINHTKDDQNIPVEISIVFPYLPCAIISLDKWDIWGNHNQDVKEGLSKFLTEENKDYFHYTYFNKEKYKYSDKKPEHNIIIEEAKKQIKDNNGCRLQGKFNVKSVGGEFHISFHGYIEEFRRLFSDGYIPNFTYIIEYLRFNNVKEGHKMKVIEEFHDSKYNNFDTYRPFYNVNKEYGFPFHALHVLKLIPSKYHLKSGRVLELFQFSHKDMIVRDNQPLIEFQLKIENMVLEYKREYMPFWYFIIKIISLIGGLYLIIDFLKIIFEESFIKLIYKDHVGKLE